MVAYVFLRRRPILEPEYLGPVLQLELLQEPSLHEHVHCIGDDGSEILLALHLNPPSDAFDAISRIRMRAAVALNFIGDAADRCPQARTSLSEHARAISLPTPRAGNSQIRSDIWRSPRMLRVNSDPGRQLAAGSKAGLVSRPVGRIVDVDLRSAAETISLE